MDSKCSLDNQDTQEVGDRQQNSLENQDIQEEEDRDQTSLNNEDEEDRLQTPFEKRCTSVV